MQIAVLGIDLGKNSCSLAGLDNTGRVVMRRRLRRESVIKFAASLPPSIVAMEASPALTTSAASCAARGTRFG